MMEETLIISKPWVGDADATHAALSQSLLNVRTPQRRWESQDSTGLAADAADAALSLSLPDVHTHQRQRESQKRNRESQAGIGLASLHLSLQNAHLHQGVRKRQQ